VKEPLWKSEISLTSGESFTNATTPMNTIFFNVNFSKKMTSFTVSLIAFAVSEFVGFVQPSMLASGCYGKVRGIDATFSSAIVMQDAVIKNLLVVQKPNASVDRSVPLSVTILTGKAIPQPAARIGLDENNISNALWKSTKFSLQHTGPIVAGMPRWGQFFL
jgi:hypothetical protein